MHGAFGKSLDYQGGEYGIAILSRWPIVAHETVPLHIEPPQVRAGGSTEPRVALVVTIQSPRGPIRVVNTHLDASRDDAYRMQEAPAVVAIAQDAIAGGDFNSEPDSRVHETVMRSGMHDAWIECGRGRALTFPAIAPRKRIDYIFLRGGCKSASVIDTDASDHRPLLVVLTGGGS